MNNLSNILNNKAIANLPVQQQIVYTAMMMDPKMIPDYNSQALEEANKLGIKIKKFFDDKVFTRMYFDTNQNVILE